VGGVPSLRGEPMWLVYVCIQDMSGISGGIALCPELWTVRQPDCTPPNTRAHVHKRTRTYLSCSRSWSTSETCSTARASAGRRDGMVVVSAISWMVSKWCCRWASASCWEGKGRVSDLRQAGGHNGSIVTRRKGAREGKGSPVQQFFALGGDICGEWPL
jgi:hypothetical protein